jgi:predicted aspartyl protease
LRFSYTEREVDPLPGIPGSDREWEPLITVRVGGPASIQLVRGLVDTGASLTLIPIDYFEKLGAIPAGTTVLTGSGVRFTVRLAHVDLELRTARTVHTWSALVGFVRRGQALWGQMGFLEHFLATYNTRQRMLTLRPNWPFPSPLYVGPESM